MYKVSGELTVIPITIC